MAEGPRRVIRIGVCVGLASLGVGLFLPTAPAIAAMPLGQIGSYTVPTTDSDPSGITSGPDGNLWFTEFGANQIGMINPTTHAIAEFTLAAPQVVRVAVGQSKKSISYTVTFAAPLNSASANNPGLYQVLQGVTKRKQKVYTK